MAVAREEISSQGPGHWLSRSQSSSAEIDEGNLLACLQCGPVAGHSCVRAGMLRFSLDLGVCRPHDFSKVQHTFASFVLFLTLSHRNVLKHVTIAGWKLPTLTDATEKKSMPHSASCRFMCMEVRPAKSTMIAYVAMEQSARDACASVKNFIEVSRQRQDTAWVLQPCGLVYLGGVVGVADPGSYSVAYVDVFSIDNLTGCTPPQLDAT